VDFHGKRNDPGGAIHEGDNEYSEDILKKAKGEKALDKRNFAMLMLEKYTGLRETDIKDLKLDDIDWRNAEIKIIQNKTGKPLSLPLIREVGDALSDYILNARPKCDCREIFIRACAPYTKL
jgi:integrase